MTSVSAFQSKMTILYKGWQNNISNITYTLLHTNPTIKLFKAYHTYFSTDYNRGMYFKVVF